MDTLDATRPIKLGIFPEENLGAWGNMGSGNSGHPAPPKVSDSPVSIAARKVTYEAQTCPKCQADLNVTAIEVGTLIECNCGNITPRAKQLTPIKDLIKERTSAFLVTFVLGAASGVAGNYAYAILTGPAAVAASVNEAQEGTK